MTAQTRTKGLYSAVLTLGVGGSGAALFWLIGFPAAPLTGPAAAVSLATVLGLKTHIPNLLRDTCFLLLGMSIGSTVTPEVLATMRAWPLSLVLLGVSLMASMWLVRWMMQRVFAMDTITALLASTPGHLSYVLGLSTQVKANVPMVALVQSVRVLLLTLLVPLLVSIWFAPGVEPAQAPAAMAALLIALVFVLSIGAGALFKRVQVPAPFLIGGIVVSALGHGTDITPGNLPPCLLIATFVAMGCLIGTRFNGISRSEFRNALGAGVLATIVACILAVLAALAASSFVDVPIAALLLAFAPGGVEVMAALAVEANLEPAFVAAHHVFRLALLTVLFPILLSRASK